MARRTRIWRGELLTLAIAATGGLVFTLFGVPAAWLSGAMIAVALIGFLRPLRPLRPAWFDSTMLLSGVLIGSAATPEALAAAARYPGSLAILCVGMAAIIFATGAYLHYVARWSWIDAILAATPGALSAVIAVAQAKGADLGRIAVIQLFRLLVLVALLPSFMQVSGHAVAGATPATLVADVRDTVLLLGCALAMGLLFERLKVTAPMILGATLSSSLLHGFEIVHGTLPSQVTIVALVCLGAVTGGRVASLKRREIALLFPLAVGGFAVSMVVAFAFAWPAAWLAGVPYATAMAAFAPGGLEAMAMLAFSLGLDPLYVGAHHLTRFMLLGLVMPFVVARLVPSKAQEP